MNNITIIKLGAIGDVIQAAAAADQYRKLNPGVAIDWVVGKQLESLLVSMNVADRVIAIEDQSILHGKPVARLQSLLKAFNQIFKQISHCNQLYIAHSNWQYCVFAIPLLLKNPTLLFGGIKRFYPELTKFRVSEYFYFLSQGSLTGQQGNVALQNLGINALSSKESLKFNADPSRKYVALVPGGSRNMMRDDFLRRWPIESYVELASKFLANGYEVVLVGGKGDVWVKPYFSEFRVRDLIGETSINDVIEIFSKVNLVISHDTGPLHLATMTSTPLIAIFGPTPASAVVSVERQSLAVFKAAADVVCSPCYDGVSYAPCQDPICMRSTTIDAVFQKAIIVLSGDTLGAK